MARTALSYIQNNLHIQDKNGRLIKFRFNPAQKRLYQEIQRQRKEGRPVRIIILKARQVGFSTAVAALFYERSARAANVNSMIVAHKAEASQNIFAKTKLFWETSPAEERPMRRTSNARELLFENPSKKQEEREADPGLRSRIRIETAGARDAGRSATIHNLHLSELAFWPHASETMLSLMQAVPHAKNTMVIIESTAGGVGGEFYEQWQRAVRGESEFVPLFFPWWEHDEYALDAREGAEEELWDEDELAQAEEYGLSPRQLRWRRWCVSANCGGDPDRFCQEYPASADEAFLVSGRPVFSSRALAKAYGQAAPFLRQGDVVWRDGTPGGGVEFREGRRGGLLIYEEPRPGGDYWIGVDASSGLAGGDYSAMAVVERDTMLPVAYWHGVIDPDLLGEVAVRVAAYYNRAMLAPELNNQGIAVINAIRRLHWPRLYRRRSVNRSEELLSCEFGFHTNAHTKPLMITNLARYIREDALRIRDKETIGECLSYMRDDKGGTNARAGCHDDRVMALAIALWTAGETRRDGPDFVEADWGSLYGANGNTGY